MDWRWDQGRLGHFSFANIRGAARAFAALGAVRMVPGDPLRPALLANTTGIAYKPENRVNYPVWRNHKRIFESCLIATKVGKNLFMTDLGQRLAADDDFTADDYLTLCTQRFRYPFPAFKGYEATSERFYPFCAVLKYLFARLTTDALPPLTVATLAAYIIGNNCTGTEDLSHYRSLRETSYALRDVPERQAREILIFISQFSFLQWIDGTLELEGQAEAKREELLDIATPDLLPALPLPTEELLSRGRLAVDFEPIELPLIEPQAEDEMAFSEGQKIRRSHLRVERSGLLRKVFFERNAPANCDMCQMDIARRYPWAGNLLELHHLLPLASSLAIDDSGTLLTDVVPLCPTCHRSIHAYYRSWLNASHRRDFAGRTEARQVYDEAKTQLLFL